MSKQSVSVKSQLEVILSVRLILEFYQETFVRNIYCIRVQCSLTMRLFSQIDNLYKESAYFRILPFRQVLFLKVKEMKWVGRDF